VLSQDDLSNGVTFILKLSDATGAPAQWVQTLRGATAMQWYEIFRRSDWEALRAQGGAVFVNRVSEAEVEKVRNAARCIVIHTLLVQAEEIDKTAERPKPLEPGWENEGGTLAEVRGPSDEWRAC